MKIMQELRYNPKAFWRLDDDSPFTDYSGNAYSGTRASTERRSVPLTATAAYGQLFDQTRLGTFTLPALNPVAAFSLSFSIYPVSDSEFTISAYNDAFGFRFTPNSVALYFNFTSTDEIELTHEYTTSQKLNVVAIYTPSAVRLYVNNVEVDSADVPEAARVDGLASSGTSLLLADAGSTGSAVVNNIAFFNTELSVERIKEIHSANTKVSGGTPCAAYGGQVVPITVANRKPRWEFLYNSEDHWNTGQHNLTSVDDNRLEAQKDEDGLTLESSWLIMIPFVSPEDLPDMYSRYLWWEGKNATVSVGATTGSLTATTPGAELIGGSAFVADNTTFYIEVSFPAGEEEAYVESLWMRAFDSLTAQMTPDTRVVTYTGYTTAYDTRTPHWMRGDWGVRIGASGSLSIGVPTGGETIKTLEFWVKPDTVVNTNRTGTTTYVNGVAGGTIIPDMWNLVHITSTTGWTTATDFGVNQQIGQVAYYDTVLTADQVSAVMRAYTGIVTTTVSGSAPLAIAEAATPASIYAHDWSKLSPVG